jgi:3',5'-cyclic AMP phosphodiesterase CpdA
MEQRICRILWISDIHFRKQYSSENERYPRLNTFLESFFEIVNDYHKKNPIDYIVFSGDLAFSGIKEDYEAFEKMIVNKLPPKVSVLSIPGNHDVCWGNLWIEWDKIQVSDVEKRLEKKNNTLKAQEKDFIKQFTNYSKSTKKYYLDTNNYIDKSYTDNRLYGYVVNESEKIIFILINSSWFSLGGGFNKKLLSHTPKLEPEKIVKLKDQASEFGGQIIGRELLKKTEVTDLFKKYPQYTVITCMHHPLHWLEWSEYNTYNTAGKDVLILNQILNNTDILLTGHEHVPEYIKPHKAEDESMYHLKAGAFLEDWVDTSDDAILFKHNRFSFLEISLSEFVEKRYRYEDTKWICTNINTQRPYQLTRKNKKPFSISAEDQLIFTQQFISNIDSFLKKYFETKLEKPLGNLENLNIISDEFQAFYSKEQEMVLIIPQKSTFYADITQFHDNNTHPFDDIFNMNISIRELRFFFLDISVNINLSEKYEQVESKLEQQEVLQEIIQYADHYFDIFRDMYFSRYEDLSNTLTVPFNKISEVNFVNFILPFWIYQKNI